MNVEVIFLPSAYADLARLWTDNIPLRRSTNRASDRVEQELARDAHLKGTPVDNYRTIRESPLLSLYSVSVDHAKVWIVQFRLTEG